MRRFLSWSAALLLLLGNALAAPCVSGTDALGYLLADGESGAILVPPGTYNTLYALPGSLFAAQDDDGWHLLNAQGQFAMETCWQEIAVAGDMLLLRQDDLFALYDTDLHPVTEHLYTQVVATGTGSYIAIKTEPNDDRGDGLYLLNASGEEEATNTVTVYGLQPFSCGRSAAVGAGNKRTGYIGTDGKWAIHPQYGYGGAFSEQGMAPASADSGAGVIDLQGNWILLPEYESISLDPANRLLAADGQKDILLFDMMNRETICRISGSSAYARTRDLRDSVLVTVEDSVSLYAADGQVVASWPEEKGPAVAMMGDRHMQLYLEGEEYLTDAFAQVLAGPAQRIGRLSDTCFFARQENLFFLMDEEGFSLSQVKANALTPLSDSFFAAWIDDGVSLLPIPSGQPVG